MGIVATIHGKKDRCRQRVLHLDAARSVSIDVSASVRYPALKPNVMGSVDVTSMASRASLSTAVEESP